MLRYINLIVDSFPLEALTGFGIAVGPIEGSMSFRYIQA